MFLGRLAVGHGAIPAVALPQGPDRGGAYYRTHRDIVLNILLACSGSAVTSSSGRLIVKRIQWVAGVSRTLTCLVLNE